MEKAQAATYIAMHDEIFVVLFSFKYRQTSLKQHSNVIQNKVVAVTSTICTETSEMPGFPNACSCMSRECYCIK